MRIAHHLLRSRFGIFHFRLKVPADLHAAVGRSIIKVSLRTTDPRVAQIYSCRLSVHYAEAFAALRGAAVPKPPPIAAILANHEAGGTRRFEVEFDPTSMRPKRLKTDGSEQDNQAALGALRFLAQQALALPPAPLPVVNLPSVKAPAKSAVTLTEAIKLYTEAEAPSLKPNTWSQRKRAFESLKSFLGADTPAASVTHVHQSSYMRPWSAQELASLFPGLTWGTWLRKAELIPLLAPCDARLRPELQRRKRRKTK